MVNSITGYACINPGELEAAAYSADYMTQGEKSLEVPKATQEVLSCNITTVITTVHVVLTRLFSILPTTSFFVYIRLTCTQSTGIMYRPTETEL